MNVILNTPISVTLNSGFLVSETTGIPPLMGTIQFQINGQPVCLAIPLTDYIYDTIFTVGCRVKLSEDFGSLGINSEGTLNKIIIDSTDDKGDVFFDSVLPDHSWDDSNTLKAESGNVSVLVRVPLRILIKI